MIALTPVKHTPNLGALIEAQGEALAITVDQATAIFKENQAKQKETIDCLTKTVDSLQAELIKSRGEIDLLKRTHEEALKALKDKEVHRTTLFLEALDRIIAHSYRISVLQRNIPYVNSHETFAAYMKEDPSIGYGVITDHLGYSGSLFGFQSWVLNHIDPEFKENPIAFPVGAVERFAQESKQAADLIQTHVNSLKNQLKPQAP